MNNWMKMGIAGIALAGTLNSNAGKIVKSDNNSAIKPSFKIEASDLIAKKQRDYKNDQEEIKTSFSIEASDLIAKKERDYRNEEERKILV